MRAFLFSLLAAVAAIMLWAIRSESYQNGVVFTLSTLAAGLCGYLLSDYFFNIEKKSLKQDVVSVSKEIQALKDEKDLLQTQFNLATPHAQVEQLEQQLAFADEQRNKLDGLSRAQYAEIAGLKTQLDMQKKNYQKLYEESSIAAETHSAELANLQDSLTSKRDKIKYLTDEGDYLRAKIAKLQTVAEEETIQKVVSEISQPPAPNLPKMVVKMPQNGAHTEGSVLQMMDPRAIKKIDAIDVASTVVSPEERVEKKTIDAEPVIENRDIAIEPQVVDNQPIAMSKSITSHAMTAPRALEPEAVTTTDATNLQAIQGIDAAMESALKSAGIDNWQEISDTSPERLTEILTEAKIHDTDVSHWSVQAILLADGHLNRLKTYLENLNK
jgi:predicted flap endonuclease-1-like 5' DNA nuclease/predicted  nucleic acid-binding Zn-ribbon protein